MRWLVGLLLLAAALLKAYQLLFDPSVVVASSGDRSLLFVQVVLEYGLALLVFSGLHWHRLRLIVLVLFSVFAVYSLCLAISGAASCGCFGPVKVSPWWTFLIDVGIVLGLAFSIRNKRQASTIYYRSATKNALLCIGLLFLAPLLPLSTGLFAKATRTTDGLISQVGNLTILDPQEWIGKELPIAPYIDLDLSQGRWTVLLHRHDCPQCQEELPKCEELALEEQVALVEVPPFDDAMLPAGGTARHARLTSDREWFVQTPVEIILEEGIVVAASNQHE